MYAVSSNRTEQGISFKAAIKRQQEADAQARAVEAQRMKIVDERRRKASEAFEQSLAIYREVTNSTPSGKPPVRRIIMNVAREYGTTYEAIVGYCRMRRIIDARFEAIRRVKNVYQDISMPQLGRHFGGRDHTTILHALRKTGYYDDGQALDRQEGTTA